MILPTCYTIKAKRCMLSNSQSMQKEKCAAKLVLNCFCRRAGDIPIPSHYFVILLKCLHAGSCDQKKFKPISFVLPHWQPPHTKTCLVSKLLSLLNVPKRFLYFLDYSNIDKMLVGIQHLKEIMLNIYFCKEATLH